VLYLFALSGLGLLISTLSNNLSETVLFSILILVPIMFLSGAFVSPEVLPAWVRALMHLSPLKYYMDITNGIFFKGNSLGSMWKLVAGLAAIGAGAFSLGAHRFRRAFQ
jgi:ABC-2 type transport system permease protein